MLNITENLFLCFLCVTFGLVLVAGIFFVIGVVIDFIPELLNSIENAKTAIRKYSKKKEKQ